MFTTNFFFNEFERRFTELKDLVGACELSSELRAVFLLYHQIKRHDNVLLQEEVLVYEAPQLAPVRSGIEAGKDGAVNVQDGNQALGKSLVGCL